MSLDLGTSSIRRLAADDWSLALATLTRAFQQYPMMVDTAPDPARRIAAAEVLYGAILHDCFSQGEVWATPHCRAIACWLPPERAYPGFWRQAWAGMWRLAFWPGPRGLLRLMAYDQVGQALHHQFAGDPHWYLSVIGVDPGFQRQGLAGQLLRPALERAQAAGLPCYLETHDPVNVPLYERFGFRVCEERVVRGRPVRVWGMRWVPA